MQLTNKKQQLCEAQKDPYDGGWVMVCKLRKGHYGHHEDDLGHRWQ